MRHQRHGRLARLAAVGAVALTGACAHNDVLVFGTSTTIGLNVETASANGAAPSIVLGYEREEAVWMPLVVNGRESVPLCGAPQEPPANRRCSEGSVPVEQALYRSEVEQAGQVTRDAYSVFASLGARFNGGANAQDGATAGGGLAQFFATGNAALNISANEALMTALKIESPAGAQAQAEAVAAAAGNGTATSIQGALTPAERAASAEAGVARRNIHLRKVDLVMLCVSKADGTLRWGELVDALNGYAADQKAGLKQLTTRDQIRTRLTNSDVLTDDALAAGGQTFSCATT